MPIVGCGRIGHFWSVEKELPLSATATQIDLDYSRIWLSELQLGSGILSALARDGFYVLGEIVERGANGPQFAIELSASREAGLKSAVGTLEGNAEWVASQLKDRRGTMFDPAGPALGTAFHQFVTESGADPGAIAISSLRLKNHIATLFRKARISNVLDLLHLTNLDLVHALRPRTPDLLAELLPAVETFMSIQIIPIVESEPRVIGPKATGNPISDAIAFLTWELDQLSERQREVLERRYGFNGQVQTLEEVGQQLGVTRERIRQIEGSALRQVRQKQRLVASLSTYLNAIRALVGLGWEDRRTLPWLQQTGDPSLDLTAGLIRLALDISPPPAATPVQDVDEACVAVLASNGPMPLAQFLNEVMTYLDEEELATNPGFSLEARTRLGGMVEISALNEVTLGEGALNMPKAKRIIRIQAMRRILEENGPSHFSFLTERLNDEIPDEYAMSEHGLHSWLMRYTGIFVWMGQGTYGLKTQDVGIRAEQNVSAINPAQRIWKKRRKGIGDEIAAILLERGPLPLAEIETLILDRFAVLPSSVLAAINQDSINRFEIDGSHVVHLREESVERYLIA